MCAVCIVSAVLSNILKQARPEYSMLISVCSGCAIVLIICTQLTPILSAADSLFNSAGVNSDYIKVMLKAAGICYISYFGSAICKDCGQATAAENIDLCARVSIVLLTLPILTDLIDLIQSLSFAS